MKILVLAIRIPVIVTGTVTIDAFAIYIYVIFKRNNGGLRLAAITVTRFHALFCTSGVLRYSPLSKAVLTVPLNTRNEARQ